MNPDQENQMVRYLLGQLSEQEQAEVERQYLADDASFEELLAVEDDLRDAYVRGELSGKDRRAFEKRLMALSRQQEKLKFARTLHEYLMESGEPVHRVPQPVAGWRTLLRVVATHRRMVLAPALSVTLVILVVGGWWLARRNVRQLESPTAGQQTTSRSTPGIVPPETGQPQGQSPEAQVRKVPRAQEQGPPVAFVLTPGLVRGSQESRALVIPPGVSRVRLEARFEGGEYLHYIAIVRTPDNRRIWSQQNLEAQAFAGGRRIFLDLSSRLLPPGDYILTLRGLLATGSSETVAEYAFRVGNR